MTCLEVGASKQDSLNVLQSNTLTQQNTSGEKYPSSTESSSSILKAKLQIDSGIGVEGSYALSLTVPSNGESLAKSVSENFPAPY